MITVKTISRLFFVLALCTAKVGAQTPGTETAPPVAPSIPFGEKSSAAPAASPIPAATPGEKAGSAVGTAPANVSPAYILQPSDVVQISVYRELDLATTARLSGDGSITLPLAGRVVIGGMTAEKAQEVIVKRLSADYLVNPQVTLTIVEYTKQYFTVLGQVQRPGAYPLPGEGNLPLLQAIGMAGGFTRIARTGHILVKRMESGGKEKVIPVDAKKLATKDSGKGFLIYPGDTISVSESIF